MAQVSGQSCGHPPKNCVRLGWSVMGLRPPCRSREAARAYETDARLSTGHRGRRPDAKLTISTAKVRVAHLTLQGPVHAKTLVSVLRSMFWRGSPLPAILVLFVSLGAAHAAGGAD